VTLPSLISCSLFLRDPTPELARYLFILIFIWIVVLSGGEGESRTHIAGFSDRCLDHLGYRPIKQTHYSVYILV
jgi:hypothetical protein